MTSIQLSLAAILMTVAGLEGSSQAAVQWQRSEAARQAAAVQSGHEDAVYDGNPTTGREVSVTVEAANPPTTTPLAARPPHAATALINKVAKPARRGGSTSEKVDNFFFVAFCAMVVGTAGYLLAGPVGAAAGAALITGILYTEGRELFNWLDR